MKLHLLRGTLYGLIVVLVLGLGAWAVLLRQVPQRASNDPAWVFNHGSIGNEAAQGLPYWIWRVMPVVFADLLPGKGRGYAEFGMMWERGAPVPVGFSQKTLGVIPRVSPNCAFCHQGSYRLAPEDPAQLVSAGAGTRVNVQAYVRFLAAAGDDARFTGSCPNGWCSLGWPSGFLVRSGCKTQSNSRMTPNDQTHDGPSRSCRPERRRRFVA